MFASFGKLRRFWRMMIFFGVSAALCFTSFTPSERTCPAVCNPPDSSYFLPSYGHPRIAAHRTGKNSAPENTLLSVQRCLDSDDPPDIFETDLQITADGEVVLFHDLYLDEKSNAVEHFGQRHVTVFSKRYSDLYALNMGETYSDGDKTPYAGLRGDDIPDTLRIVRLEEFLDLVETTAPGQYRYIMEIKYPAPWAHRILKKVYDALTVRQMTDRVILGSYWPSVSRIIDRQYAGMLLRSANPLEIIDFYGCFFRGEDLSGEDIPFMALQLPYYWKNDRLLLANFGQTAFMDYAHRFGISVQYWTISRTADMQDLTRGGADVLMTNHPERARSAIEKTELFPKEDAS